MVEPRYAVGLDAGSQRTRCLIGALENSRVRLLGAGETEAGGWLKGRIAAQQSLVESIEKAVREAERSAGVSIGSAVVGMGGGGIEGLNNRGVYEMGRPREIDEKDIQFAVEQALDVQLPSDRMVLQMAPQDFIVDGRARYWDPQGARASRLESFVHLITASAQEHACLVGAMHQAHLAVEETVFEPVAAAYGSVSVEERASGVAVVDIGAHSTDLAIYYGEALLAASSLAISGDHFTRDVSHGLCIPREDAERLKQECGCAMLGMTADNSLIELPSPEGRRPREAPRRDLNEILEARAEELFLYVGGELSKSGTEQGRVSGIVLVGAATQLPGMCDMAERVLNCQARNGLPVGVEDWPDEIYTPAWTTAAGLMLYSARLKQRPGAAEKKPRLWERVFG